ncbi:MAG: glycosyltransferase family 2 protein [Bryobacteraceae bacterium]
MLTIVTPTYNRLSALQECLRAIVVELEPYPAEVIVVDDASTDGTWNWLQNNPRKSMLRVRRVRLDENRGPGAARNAGLNLAEGTHFCPLDSDTVLIPGAGRVLHNAMAANPDVPLLLFPCIEYPAMQRMDSLTGNRPVTRDDLLYERVQGELIPVANVSYFRARDLRYPEFRSGGEGILWIRALADRAALFVNEPIVYYRTDVPGRLCTAGHQLRRPAELAEIADALIGLFPVPLPVEARRAKARRMMASGTYYLLAGHRKLARERLRGALALGNRTALGVLAASVFGAGVCRAAFRVLRPC